MNMNTMIELPYLKYGDSITVFNLKLHGKKRAIYVNINLPGSFVKEKKKLTGLNVKKP